jgi:hypothetical protein
MKHIIITFIIGIFCISVPMLSQKKDDLSSQTETIFDKAPVPIKRVEPKYPVSMLKDSWESNVYLKVFIDVDGNVASVNTEKMDASSPNESQGEQEIAAAKKEFQEAACIAMKQWKFSPAQMQGRPVAVWVTIPIRFKLSTVKETIPIDKANRVETEKKIESIRTVIENILKGKEIEIAKKFIDINASLIYNTKMLNLYSVLNGEYKDVRLNGGKETRCVDFDVNINDGGGSALIVCTSELPKGKNKKIHSIVISKSASKEWKITHWHVSF